MNKRIKQLRLALGLSQGELGRKIGITTSAISRIESGENSASTQTVMLICREFSIDYDWLTTGQGEMFTKTHGSNLSSCPSSNNSVCINERLKQIREHLGHSQEEFGSKIGITRSSVSLLEREKNNPSEQTIMLVCREFNIDYGWLTTGQGEMFIENTEQIIKLLGTVPADAIDFARSVFRGFSRFSPDDWRHFHNMMGNFGA